MAVFRVEKTKDFTIMCNQHLRNRKLSLKAKGLLSLMLSLPEDWDYTTKGLAHIRVGIHLPRQGKDYNELLQIRIQEHHCLPERRLEKQAAISI